MLAQFLGYMPGKDGVVLDFFAGSGTTGHAVMMQNCLDGGQRRCISVQLPEPIETGDKDNNSLISICDQIGAPHSIAELTKERLRRAGKKLKAENPLFAGDLGFRVFKLDSSNLQAWDPSTQTLAADLMEKARHDKVDRSDDDLLFEVLLKRGLDLCVPIARKTIAEKTVCSVGGGVLICCFATAIGAADVDALGQGIAAWVKELAPADAPALLFRDSAFADDIVKTNLTETLRQQGLENVRSL